MEKLISVLPLKGEIGTPDRLDFICSASSNPRRAWTRFAIHAWDAAAASNATGRQRMLLIAF
jgi:hypothetical protein